MLAPPSSSPETSPRGGPRVRKARRNNSEATANTEDMGSDEDDLSSLSNEQDFAGGGFSDDDGASVDPDDVLLRVDNFLKDYDGPLAEDAQLVQLQSFLLEVQAELDQMDAEIKREEEKRQADIEEAKKNVTTTHRSTSERLESLGESKHASPEAEQMRELISRKSDEDMLKAMQSMKVYNDLFEEQKNKIRKKTAKREKLAIEMKLGARKALRRLKLVDVRGRIERENAEKAKKQANVGMDMSEWARRDRVYQWYTRTAMPNKKLLTDKIKKLPADAGVSVGDIDLLPWDEAGRRVDLKAVMQLQAAKPK